jgi:hypothetical protein
LVKRAYFRRKAKAMENDIEDWQKNFQRYISGISDGGEIEAGLKSWRWLTGVDWR